MPDGTGTPTIARFGMFEADLELRELRRQGRRVPIQEHPFLVLAVLLQQPGREVTRDELRRRLWPNLQFLDFENGINTAVGRLRQALGDTAENPRFIQTRRGHGYRFIAPVTWSESVVDTKGHRSLESTHPLNPSHRPQAWVSGAAVAVSLFILVLLSFSRWRATESDSPARDRRVDPVFVYAPPGEALTGSFALSPKGTQVAFVTAGLSANRGRLWLRRLDDVATPRPLPGTEEAAMPFWSPDERALGFFAEGKLKTIALDSGRIVSLADAVRPRGGSWGADGVILFVPDIDSPILRISARDGSATPATDLGDAPSHRFPYFLSDGRHFIYLVHREDRTKSQIRLSSVGSLDSRELFASESNGVYMASGYLFFARAEGLLTQRFDADRLQSDGLPLVVREQVGVYDEGGPTGLGMFSASADSLGVADVPPVSSRLTWFDRRGRLLSVNAPPGDYKQLDLSPDGLRAIVVRFDPRRRSSDLLIVDLRSGTQMPVTDDPYPDANGIWAPQADRIVFGSLRQGRWCAFIHSMAEPGDVRRLEGECDGMVSWFPSGRTILCSTTGRPTSLLKVDIEPGRRPVRLVTGLVFPQGRVSPDGRWLAYSSEHEGRRKIYVVALGDERVLSTPVALGAGDSPRWRADGRELFFLSGSTLMSVWVQRGRGRSSFGRPQPLFDLPDVARDSLRDFLESFGVSPDGSRFLFAVPNATEARSRIVIHLHWSATALR